MPLIEFDGASADFINGAQIGELIEKLRSKRDEGVQSLFSKENETFLDRIANAFGREYTVRYLDETYMIVSFGPPTLPNVMDALHPLES
ncbi:MAG: hypothetical protein AAB541_02715 [Patescibacteria group bacterium]